MDRRAFLKGIGAAALVVGFDPLSRRWVARADASGSFDDVPPLDGHLFLDDASRAAVATDKGNIVHHKPAAVLQPGSVEDISKMIRYCAERDISVSTRGMAHSTHGQGLTSGLIIENTALNKIHSITPQGAVVDTGASWKDLVLAAYEQKLTPPVLTGYIGLSIGGTLSMGGIGGLVGGRDTGMQIDHVQELEVVTGTGEIVRCSRTVEYDLFEVALGGIGQFGVMTRAKIDLVPAKERARTYQFHYVDNAQFFSDMRILLERDGIDHLYTLWFPPGTTSLVYELQATVFYDLASPPDDLAVFEGLSVPPVIQDQTYLDYVQYVDTAVDGMRAALNWDSLIKPWFDVWLPASKVEEYVGEVIPTLTPRDIGPAGFILLFATRRSHLTNPFFRVCPSDGSNWLFLFDILTASALPGPDDAFTEEMIARNDRLFARARDHFDGVRYPIGTMTFTKDDWKTHYGPVWDELKARKHRFDPHGILTPGPGIF